MRPLQFETIPFKAKDGFDCNLLRLKRETPDTKGPVLLVHGAGVRANIFNAPTEQNIIAALGEAGYDVWLENWRASIDLEKNEWDLDIAAINDHPVAVEKVVEITGHSKIKAIIHCQGSTSFMISVMLGLVPQVAVIVSNAVSLHPVFPKIQLLKMKTLLTPIGWVTKYFNPQWGKQAPDLKSRLFRLVIRLTHHEDDTMVGKFVSFTYGAGHPALYRLENINEKIKQWISFEFAHAPITFFKHMRKCVKNDHLVPNKPTRFAKLPKKEDRATRTQQGYLPEKLNLDTRIALFCGELNQCFLAESQRKTYAYLEDKQPGKHSLHVIPKYSHLDIFFGKNAHKDVFPLMIKELDRQTDNS